MPAVVVRSLSVFVAFLVVAEPLTAQRADSALTIERIFASPEFNVRRLGGARWRPGVEAYTRLEPSTSRRGVVRSSTMSWVGSKTPGSSSTRSTPFKPACCWRTSSACGWYMNVPERGGVKRATNESRLAIAGAILPGWPEKSATPSE